jgi:hypothetical protein
MYHKGRYDARNGERKRAVPHPSLSKNSEVSLAGLDHLPGIIVRAGNHAARRFVKFFTATIRNRNTRAAYAQSVGQFCRWCEGRGMELRDVSPIAIAGYVEDLMSKREAPTVKQHLAAIRMHFDWLVTGHVVPVGARPEARREEGKDPGTDRRRSPATPRQHRRFHRH